MANTTGQKHGGRQKGTPNKTTTEIRETLQKFISTNIENLQNDFDKLEPQQKIKTIVELTKFVLPTFKAIEQTIKENESQLVAPMIIFKTPYNDEV